MKTIKDEGYMKNLYYWIYHVEQGINSVVPDLMDAYVGWMEKFDNWKKRNVDNIHLP